MSRGRLRAAMLLAATAACLSTWSRSAPVGAVDGGSCSTADGVTVVVDFRSLGGGVVVRCAPGQAASGFDALARAGIAFDTAVRSPGFLCRIAGKPASDPCIDPSPAGAHWSYWLADGRGRWCYSNLGAANRRPPAGTVEGWSFVQGSGPESSLPPGIDPPAVPAGSKSLPASHCDGSSPAPTTAPPTSRPEDRTGVAAPAPAPAPAPGGATPGGATPGVPGKTAPAPAPSVPAGDAAGGTTTTTSTPGSGPADDPLPADATETDEEAQVAGAVEDGSRVGDEQLERAAARVSTGTLDESQAGSGPLGSVLAATAVAALAAAASVFRRRRRAAEASGAT